MHRPLAEMPRNNRKSRAESRQWSLTHVTVKLGIFLGGLLLSLEGLRLVFYGYLGRMAPSVPPALALTASGIADADRTRPSGLHPATTAASNGTAAIRPNCRTPIVFPLTWPIGHDRYLQ